MFNKRQWQDGEVVDGAKMNDLEDRIYDNVISQTSESDGVISFKNGDGDTVFTVTLPIYNGGVS